MTGIKGLKELDKRVNQLQKELNSTRNMRKVAYLRRTLQEISTQK